MSLDACIMFYYHITRTQAKNSYDHGCGVISVANWDLASLQNRSGSLFRRIARDFLGTPTSSVPASGGHMNISALGVFNAGSAMQ